MYVTQYVDNTRYGQSSVAEYAGYLEKESLIQSQLDETSSRQLSAYLDKQNDVVRVEGREYFFNGTGNTYDTEDVVKNIDANVRGLKKKEARYYTFSISPSKEEIAHLRRTIADTKQTLLEAGEAIPARLEDDMMRNYLKDYAIQCMDAYARNFGHPEIHDNRDLMWFGMVEKDRYWKSHDPHVRNNSRIDKEIVRLEKQLGGGKDDSVQRRIADLEAQYVRESHVRLGGRDEILRAMMPKAGDNWHIHVTVSRRDITNSINLSPNANGRGSKKHVLNGKAVRVGFDREAYKIECERLFDRLFAHHRLQTESYEVSKRLRHMSGFAFEKQLAQDRATRRAEAAEFRQLVSGGYGEYYESLLQAEQLDARQLMRLKGQLVRQLRLLNPVLDATALMDSSVEELQEELNRVTMDQDLSLPHWGQSLGVGLGDKAVEVSGLRGYHPVRTAHKVLRKGLAMRQAVDRRRDVFDQWSEIYRNAWHRENYVFDSISTRRNTDCLFVQTEYLEEVFEGDSVLLENAVRYLADTERQLVGEYVQCFWPERQREILTSFARETFGADGAYVKDMKDFESMVRERLLPEDARRCIAEAVSRCEQPATFDALRFEIAACPADRAAELTVQLENFQTERMQLMEQLRSVLADQTLGVHAKEESLLRLALQDRNMDKALRDLRAGVVKIYEKKHPELKPRQLQKQLKELFAELSKIRVKHQADFAKTIDAFIREELPGYHLLVEKQTQLEQLIRETTLDPNKCAERILEMNNELAREVSPHAERLFEQHSRLLFGPEVRLRNEHDFSVYVDQNYSPEQARRYKDSLKGVYARIEEKRRNIIQRLVQTIPQEDLEKIQRQQSYLNRYINKYFSAAESKTKKEALQRRVSSSYRRSVSPVPEYKVYGAVAQRDVSVQAMAKADQVKMVQPVTPQQLAIKAAFKLVGILTKGY